MPDLVCKGCGGSLTLSAGQTMILPTTTISYDGERLVDEWTTDDAWCGDCIDKWNEALREEPHDV